MRGWRVRGWRVRRVRGERRVRWGKSGRESETRGNSGE